jgi:predicted dehydrogenase
MRKKASHKSSGISRRDFVKASVSLAPLSLVGTGVFASGSDKLRVGLIGCGSRGNEALGHFQEAAKHLGLKMEVLATADWFRAKAQKTAKVHGVPGKRCFSGARAYSELLETDVDIVLMATPPVFRPLHFEAAVNAGKHVFIEKPVCVDPPGGRRIIQAGELAKKKGLAVGAGTQRRHQSGYRRNQYAVEQGAIGKIIGGCVWWCAGRPWHRKRDKDQSDADYLIGNWVNLTEMSGDHIVEQHVHNLDVANWFIGHPPLRAVGFGGRARRKTGNQYDFFSVQFDYRDDCHIHSMCRQINGCYGRVSEHFVGTEGSTWGDGELTSASGKNISVPDFPEHEGPYVQEHVDLLNSIVQDKPINEARAIAESTLTAVMGRISAYTGKLVRWSDMMDPGKNSRWYGLALTPAAEDFERGNVKAPPDNVFPVPGIEMMGFQRGGNV